MKTPLLFVGLCLLATCDAQESSSATPDAEEGFSCMCVPKDECKDDTLEDKPKLPKQVDDNRCGPEQVCCSHLIVRTEKTVERHSYYFREGKDVNDPDVVQLGEFPWHAVLFTADDDFVCSGILVSSRHVLSTADCAGKFQGSDVTKLNVRFGTLDHASVEGTGTNATYKVKKVTLHPDFQSSSRNNLAVLEMTEEVPFSEAVRRVPVARPEDSFEGKTCLVSGWGKNLKHGSVSKLMKKANVTVLEKAPCQELLQTARPEDGVICVSGPQTCQGDEGGPLVCRREVGGDQVLAAVVSHGDFTCGARPAVLYPDVSKSLDFLAQATGHSKDFFASAALISS